MDTATVTGFIRVCMLCLLLNLCIADTSSCRWNTCKCLNCTYETNGKNGDECVAEDGDVCLYVSRCALSRSMQWNIHVCGREKLLTCKARFTVYDPKCPCMIRLKKNCKAIKWSGDKTCDDENNHTGCNWDGARTFNLNLLCICKYVYTV